MVFLPVQPLGPFEHVHEGKRKWFKYCRPEFYVLCYDMKQKYVSDMKYFVVIDIYFFIYNKIKVSPPSTLYIKKLISIIAKYFISTS